MNRELLISDFKQMRRFYEPNDLPEMLADYIEKHFIQRIGPTPGERVHKDLVIGLCCQYFGQGLDEMGKPSRIEEIRLMRQKTMFLLRRFSRISVVDIGKLFNRHYTTVLASEERISDLMITDPIVQKDIDALSRLLNPQSYESFRQD